MFLPFGLVGFCLGGSGGQACSGVFVGLQRFTCCVLGGCYGFSHVVGRGRLGTGDFEGEVAVVGGDARAVVAQLVAIGAIDGKVFLRKALYLLAEHHMAFEGADGAVEVFVELLVGLGLTDRADEFVVGCERELESDGERTVGVGVLGIDVPALVELGGENQLRLSFIEVFYLERPFGGVLYLGRCHEGEAQTEQKR